MGVVFGSVGDDEGVAGFDGLGGLAFDQDFALAFEDVTEFVAGVGVASGEDSGGDFDFGDDRFATGHRDVFPLDDRPLDAWVLGYQGCGDRDEQGDSFHAGIVSPDQTRLKGTCPLRERRVGLFGVDFQFGYGFGCFLCVELAVSCELRKRSHYDCRGVNFEVLP